MKMTSAASWFFLTLLVCIAAVLLTIMERARTAEMYSDMAPYGAELELPANDHARGADPELDGLSPEQTADALAPELPQATTDKAEEEPVEEPSTGDKPVGEDEVVEPFVGEEFTPF